MSGRVLKTAVFLPHISTRQASHNTVEPCLGLPIGPKSSETLWCVWTGRNVISLSTNRSDVLLTIKRNESPNCLIRPSSCGALSSQRIHRPQLCWRMVLHRFIHRTPCLARSEEWPNELEFIRLRCRRICQQSCSCWPPVWLVSSESWSAKVSSHRC